VCLCIVGACARSESARKGPAPRSVPSRQWDDTQGFVDRPALETPAGRAATWTLELDSTEYGTNAVFGIADRTHLRRIDPRNGTAVWSTPLPTDDGIIGPDVLMSVFHLATDGDGLVAVGRETFLTAPRDASRLDLFDAARGELQWTRSSTELSPPIVLGPDLVGFELDDQFLGFEAVELSTGITRWVNSDVHSCSAYAAALVCETTADETGIAVVDVDTGAVRWTARPERDVKASAVLPPFVEAVIGDAVYTNFDTQSSLTAFDLSSGERRWTAPVDLTEFTDLVEFDENSILVTSPTREFGSQSQVGTTRKSVVIDTATGSPDGVSWLAGEGVYHPGSVTGGLNHIEIGGTRYFVLHKPDGSVRVISHSGDTIATTGLSCASYSVMIGDSFACFKRSEMRLLAIPGLEERAAIDGLEVGVLTRPYAVGGHLLIEQDGVLMGFSAT
jgi:outer membrane protein assembly factor BamB